MIVASPATADTPVSRARSLWPWYLPLAIFWMELTLKVWTFRALTLNGFVFTLLFSTAAGLAGTFLCCLRRRFSAVTLAVLLALVALLMATQAVYYHIFKTFVVVSSLGNAGMVMGGFGAQALAGTARSWPALASIFAPLVVWLVAGRRLAPRRRLTARDRGVVIGGGVLLQLVTTLAVTASTSGLLTPAAIYQDSFVPTLAVRDFGALTTLRLDIKSLVMPDAGIAAPAVRAEAPAVATPPTPDTQPNTLDIDFAALAASRSDPTLASLDRYFGAADPTYQNDYTGAFKGKNIIWIVAESFSSWALDETHTPTLYNLAHSGFVFTNYYAPLWGVSTSDGEYTQLTGLLPKANVWSMAQSADNSLPFSFGNQLSEQGYRSLAFHDGTYTYYDRNRSLPNLGYDFSAVGHGLDLPSADLWPASDVDMIDASADRYLGQGPFNIYYLTISGHMYYTFGGDAMAAKHEADVADLPYSEGPRAYIAAQMEFDQAVKDLIDRLKAAGELDNTVLVISGDHYPYGLTTSDIDELAGHAVDQSFGLYHSSLIIWSGDMTTPVVVDKPCYSVDILPTLSNLFGLPYDSRLLMGHDILSDAAPLVIFANHSWLTDKGRFDASTDAFTPEPGADFGSETPADYARRMMSEVNQRFAASAAVLDKDYYRQVLG